MAYRNVLTFLVTAFTIMCSLSVSNGEDANYTLAAHRASQSSMFKLKVDPENLKVFFLGPPRLNTIALYVDESVTGFTVSVRSLMTSIATVSDMVGVARCNNSGEDSKVSSVHLSNGARSNLSAIPQTYSAPTAASYLVNATLRERGVCYNISFNSSAVYLGYVSLEISIRYSTKSGGNVTDVFTDTAVMKSLRYSRPIDIIFQVVVFTLVVLVTLGMGNDLNLQTIKEHMKKPKAPVIALVSQFTFMPLLAYGVIHLLGLKGGAALGFFALGCCPGGGGSNIYSKLLNGDVSISITMTTLSTIASLGMLPLWLYTLGTTLPADETVGQLKVPFLSILGSLAALIIPLFFGVLIKYKLPRVSKIIKKCLKVFFILVILFFMTFGIYSNLYVFQGFKADLLFASTLLPYGGYIFGGLMAWLCRLDWKLIKTVSLETGIQNTGIMIVIIQSALGQPDSDLAVIPPLAATIMTTMPLYIIVPVYLIRKRMLRKRRAEKDAESLDTREEEEEEEKEKLGIPLSGRGKTEKPLMVKDQRDTDSDREGTTPTDKLMT